MNFPIQSSYLAGEIREIPWDLIQAHEAQALRNHGGQSLQRLADRRGLSACEAVAVLEDKAYCDRWPPCDGTTEQQEARVREGDGALRAIVSGDIFSREAFRQSAGIRKEESGKSKV